MSEQNVVSASEMINKVFSNIDVSQIEKGNSLSNAWKETVEKIYKYGQKLVCHSQIVDLKNGILLVETDHPGWNQILQNNKNFILKGLRLKVKDIQIKSLAFRVKGNDAHLTEDYETYKKRINDEYFEKIEDDEKKLEQMGFKNEIDIIMKELPKKKQTICFSATIDSKVKKLAYRYMEDPIVVSIESEEVTLNNIKQEVIFTTDRWKTDALCTVLNEDNPFMAIIFCRTKRRVDELEEDMHKRGFNCAKLHSDIPQAKRERIMKSFRKADIQYLIATDVASRGIDVTGVDTVYNFDCPETPESYIHRIGRTGRKGEKGYTCIFIADKDRNLFKTIENSISLKIPTREVDIIKTYK